MKSRRLSTIVLICLIAVVCGLGGYIVYASVVDGVYLSATNYIIFNTSDKVYYTALVNIKYADETTYFASDSIDHGGSFLNQNLGKTEMTFNDALCFTNEHRTIVYEITITNRTTKDLKVTINKPQDQVGYYTNTLDITTPVTIDAIENPNDTSKTTTINLTAHMTSAEYSFVFDNSFTIDLETIE